MKNRFSHLINHLSRMKFGTKLLSMILVIVMAFFVVPTVVYAEAAEAISELNSSDIEATVTSVDTSSGIYELTDKRGENYKTFRLEDGSFMAAQYPTAIHRQDAEGVWQNIDNTLSASGSEISTSDARVKFAKKITGNNTLFTLHEGNAKITFSLDGAIKKTKGKIIDISEVPADTSELGKLMHLDKISSKIIYEDILDGVDIEYIVTGNDIKENIIVKEKKDSYGYSFALKLNNLTAELIESGDVIISDKDGNASYIIPAPVIFDSNGVYAENGVGAYSLTELGNGSYAFSVSVSPEWMNAEGRAFPVTVDPTVSADDENIIDTYVYSAAPYSSYGSNNYINVGVSGEDIMIGFWKIENLNSLIPKNSYIVEASMNTKGSAYNTSGSSGPLEIYATVGAYISSYDLTDDITYESLPFDPSSTATLGNPCSYAKIFTINMALSFDITAAVRTWYGDSTRNNGIILRSIDSTTYATLNSVENSNRAVPMFTVNYVSQIGLENYFPTVSHNIGDVAVGNVNLGTGNLILSIPTLRGTDSLFGFTPTLTFNSVCKNSYNQSGNFQVPFTAPAAAVGFKWNMRQSIVLKSYMDANYNMQQMYVWSDSDGTEHVFISTETYGIYHDTDGLLLTLEEVANGSLTDLHIKDTSGNVMIFREESADKDEYYTTAGSWVLEEIHDSIGNAVEFFYNERYAPTKINIKPYGSDAITTHTFIYGNLEMPLAVYNSQTNEGVVFRYSSTYNGEIASDSYKYLRQIVYVKTSVSLMQLYWSSYQSNVNSIDGRFHKKAELNISYNSGGYITSVTEAVSGKKIAYTYSGGRVANVQESAGSLQGQSVGFGYYVKYSEVTTSGADDIYGTNDDIVTRYSFDKYGRYFASYSRDKASDMILGASGVEYSTEERAKNSIKQSNESVGSFANYISNGDFAYSDAEPFKYWTATGNVTRSANKKGYSAELKPVVSNTASLSQYVYLPAGEYTLSFDIYGLDTKDCSFVVSVNSILEGSVASFSEVIPLNEYSVSINERASVHFSVSNINSSGGDKLRISFSANANASAASTASIKLGNLMLAEGIDVSNFNMVEMGGFEASTLNEDGSVLANPRNAWYYTGGTLQYFSSTGNPVFGKAGLVYADINENMYISQRIYTAPSYILGNYGTNDFSPNTGSYIVSGYAKGYAALQSGSADFELKLVVGYYQGAGATTVTKTFSVPFAPYCSEWQFVSQYISTKDPFPESENVYNCVQYIDLYCVYSYQPSAYAYFDNISVIECTDESSLTYEYYPSGLLRSRGDYFNREYYFYNENGDVSLYANTNDEICTYEYNSNRTLARENYYYLADGESLRFGEDGMLEELAVTPIRRTDYNYNSFGQPTEIKTYAYNSSLGDYDTGKAITEKRSYYTSGTIVGALQSEEDALGNETKYYYDTSGKLDSSYNVNTGDGYKYIYDTTDRLSAVYPASLSGTAQSYDSSGEKVLYSYDSANRPTQISTGGSAYYQISYNSFGNITGVKENSSTIVSYTYNSYNGKLASITYANGLTEGYIYDALDRLSEIYYNNVKRYSYTYTSKGEVHSIENHSTEEITVYTYDAAGNLTQVASSKSGYNEVGTSLDYDSNGRLSSVWNRISYSDGTSSAAFGNQYFYNTEGRLTEEYIRIVGNLNERKTYTYDNFNRLSGTSLDIGSVLINSSYTFTQVGTNLSGQIASNTVSVNGASTGYTYSYDAKGNITKIAYSSGKEIRYVYDNLNQLIREDNSILNCTYIYTYDNAGNITSTKKYALTAAGVTPTGTYTEEAYTYTNNRLVSYKGVAISYDSLGNPTSYYNGTSYSFTWQGRQLTGATKSGISYSFTYNYEGIRTSKTKSGVKTTYYLSGSTLIGEETNGNLTLYIYDANSSPIGFQYHGANYATGVFDTYVYEKNLQGDIVAVYSSAGTKLVSYAYDAYGSCTVTYYNNGASTQAASNPFRYRGYYYDSDLGLYYLNSRYYDANTGRFISQDSLSYLGANGDLVSYNLYAYCSNNPVMYVDEAGTYCRTFFHDFYDWMNEYALNKDGTYSLYDNDRFSNDTVWHEQIISASVSAPSFDLKNSNIGLGGLSLDFYTGGWEWKHANLSLIDVGHAEISAEFKDGSINVGALASAWSPSFSVTVFGIKIEVGAEIGSIGASLDIGNGNFTAKGAYGWGLSLSINW